MNYKRFTLFLSSALLLSGCGIFNKNETTTSEQAQQSSVHEQASHPQITSEQAQQEAADRTGVFNEREVTKTDLPKSTLDVPISYAELDEVIHNFYTNELDEPTRKENHQPIDAKSMDHLQHSLTNNDIFKVVNATADQVILTIDGQDNYVARVTIPYTYREANKKLKDNDILILNEALAQAGPQRLVLINYYDKSTGKVTPLHLANSSTSLFYNDTYATP